MKKIVGIIPARYNSTRLHGKPLIMIHGKPMIQHVFERSKKADLDEVYIATDDDRIADMVKSFGGNVIMTLKSHDSGTDRIAEAIKKINADIVVNIQGDEPLIRPEMINQAVSPFLKDKNVYMSTLIKKIDDTEDLFNPSIAKVIVDSNNYAIYFSRSIIPYPREMKEINIKYFKRNNIVKKFIFYKHIGLYVYTKQFLLKFSGLSPSNLEKIEKLEQLRVLENGFKIKTVETEFSTLGVDTKYELNKVRRLMTKE